MANMPVVLEPAEREEAGREVREIIVKTFWSKEKGAHDTMKYIGPMEGDSTDITEQDYNINNVINIIKTKVNILIKERRLLFLMKIWEFDFLATPEERDAQKDPESHLFVYLLIALKYKKPLKECKSCGNIFVTGTNPRVAYCSDNCKYYAAGRADLRPEFIGSKARSALKQEERKRA